MTLSKKIYALAVCATLVLLQSCAKEELDLDKLNQFSEPKNITVSASLPQASNTSKTIIAFNDSGKVLWETTDAISVNGTTLSNISISPTDERKATFSGEVSPLSETYYWGVYPTSIATAKNGDNYTTSGVKVNLPTTQTYKGDTIPSFMVAYCSTSDDEVTLTFKNLCSIIKIPVQAASGFSGDSAQLRKIEITSTQNISGTATVSWSDSIPTLSFTNGSKKIILDCGNTDVTLQRYFYIMIPAGSSTQNLTINFYDNTGYYMQKKITGANLTRSRIHTTNPVTLNTRTDALWESGDFSVSANLKVRFSSGNLQWSAKGGGSTATTHAVAGGSTAPGTWRFAEHQYDYVGDASNGNVYIGSTKCNNASITSSYAGWIDLFGFGTSGYNSKNPYMTSTTYSDYPSAIANTNYDWGVYNAIQEGSTTHPAGTWRTLTSAEWEYLSDARTASTINGVANARYALVKVNSIAGMMLFPDVFTWPSGAGSAPTTFNTCQNTWNSVNYTTAQFAILEASGVVFLPVSGYRNGSSVSYASSCGNYWSSTRSSSMSNNKYVYVYGPRFDSVSVDPDYNHYRYNGHAVRLVR